MEDEITMKSIKEVEEMIKEVEEVNKANAPYPYSEDERLLKYLLSTKEMYENGTNKEIWKEFHSYYKPKYGPYISAEPRLAAEKEANDYLDKNLRKTKSEKKRALIWKKYEEMRPPYYDKYTWEYYHFLAWLCNEGELCRPVKRSEVHQAWCALSRLCEKYDVEHSKNERRTRTK